MLKLGRIVFELEAFRCAVGHIQDFRRFFQVSVNRIGWLDWSYMATTSHGTNMHKHTVTITGDFPIASSATS